MQVKISAIAAQHKCLAQELREALNTLGFKISFQKKDYWVEGTVQYALLNNGDKADAVQAAADLTSYAAQYNKSLQEIALVISQHKEGEPSAASPGTINEAPVQESTIAQEVELDELDEQTKQNLETAQQAFLQRSSEANRILGDVLGLLLQADRIKKIQEGQGRAWENPQTRAALEGLIDQETDCLLGSVLVGEPDSARPKKLKLKSISTLTAALPQPTTEFIAVPAVPPTNSSENSIKTLALPSASTNNGKKP